MTAAAAATTGVDGSATGPVALESRLRALLDVWPAGTPLPSTLADDATTLVADLVAALEAGTLRAATPDPGAPDGWRVDAWVKQAILLGFRIPGLRDYRDGPIMAARDKVSYGVLDILDSPGARAAMAAGTPWRVVPGGTTARSGVHLEPGVTIMPPAYLNVGAWVGRGTMVDSHALVGSCAQVGERVHLSAAVQVGGVLEPAGARPVVVEDDAFVGGGCGLYDGVIVGRGAVLGAGVVLTGQSRLIDLVGERELRGTPESPLVVPPGSVVVPGSRPAAGPWAREQGIALGVAVIVKQRDAGTDARVVLEDALR
ncbi:MAG: 2,3,4,5-tetrahydropyridine-2,6-dicarboxylate N-succinyltransferase [Chloroflexi bacterium]|nr:2,3,4,5-tetrahydropyridine-2,6-dicarboxylate N-succinyltransferase [Chloroflexota bacterium]